MLAKILSMFVWDILVFLTYSLNLPVPPSPSTTELNPIVEPARFLEIVTFCLPLNLLSFPSRCQNSQPGYLIVFL